MKKIITCFICLVLGISLYSQKEFDKWVFGKGAGLDFTSGTAVVMNTTCNGWDNSASIADSAGNLLFSSDGQRIYDRNGNIMPNGSGIMGDTSGGSAATIVKMPGSHNLYYVFTDPGYNNPQGFEYTIVDMSLNGGLGDVDVANKNVIVFSPFTEKIVPIIHANGQDVWVLVHEWNSNVYRTYLLTANGLQPNYVVSPTGNVITGSTDNAMGQLTVNRSGSMVACAILHAGIIDISSFDNVTGFVSNTISISDSTFVIGLEFSPDGSKLYSSNLYGPTLKQYDVTNFDSAAVASSMVTVGFLPTTWARYYGGYLMLGPDGRIYVSVTFSHNVGVIDSPNSVGMSCSYNGTEINLGQHTIAAGLVDKIAVTPLRGPTSINTVSSAQNPSVQSFPNPFSDFTHITVAGVQTPYDFELFDITGSLRKSIQGLDSKAFELKCDGLSSGMYFYRIVVDAKSIGQGKLVVQ